MSTSSHTELPALARAGHAAHCKRCLSGLPGSQVEVDGARLALSFYCIGSLDLLGVFFEKTSQFDREEWREWIWEQHISGKYGTGFRPSPFMTTAGIAEGYEYTDYDTPHIIMTYTALLCLAILRDDFSRLDRTGLTTFIRACQREDGSFSTVPGSGEFDLRTLYCAFAISSMLDDWSGINVPRAVEFISTCRTYEGGYGQSPFCEAQGGTSYIAIASLHLAPSSFLPNGPLTPAERELTVNWLLQNQAPSGGFKGRTNKEADACYCFWCGAGLHILGAKEFVDKQALAGFLASCQFKYGGISKAPGEHPDPYHTYLSLAALAMYSPYTEGAEGNEATWQFESLDPLLNAKESTARWAREHIPARSIATTGHGVGVE
ncbi:terpenoid cyclases/Protein prenyltransferase [Pluteus cervinus]|uniref:Terpenoid cyclases/Protein prenyltransferase n=1 Tax=Pluteus cervinus TaxID=181527 RepID=A0ACD3AYD9_9AGAR|nr:terpenoid cyclases/Protein prenyltransferase [Pluteus cervinus]